MTERWGLVAAAVAFTGLGILAGFQAGRAGMAPTESEHAMDPAADPNADPDAEHAHEGEIEFSPQTLANLGVTTTELTLTTWTRTLRVAAVVEETPLALRPAYTPVGGRVVERHVTPPQVVASGEPLIDLVREPIPLPPIQLTADALHPAHEEIHAAVRSLRKARGEIEILEAEAARIDAIPDEGELPLVPRQRRIELDYDLERSRIAADQAAHELEKHGFSEEQVEALARGEHLPFYGASNVRRTLDHNGLWRADAMALEERLPEALRELPLVVATIGELAGHGLATADLAAWLGEDPSAARAFLRIASLLLSGHSLADVRNLHAQGALEDRVTVRAPRDADEWDLLALHVRIGASVPPGTLVATLRDGRALRLRATPVGREIEALTAALHNGLACRATPLLPGTGPELDGLAVTQIAEVDARTVAWLDVENALLAGADLESGTPPRRSWQLRPGLRYSLRVPQEHLDNVYVLPVTAVTRDGAERVVLLPDAHGDVFEEVPVVIAIEDDEVVVLRANQQDPRLAPGTTVVRTGAFEIGLALHAGDHDAGHSHGH